MAAVAAVAEDGNKSPKSKGKVGLRQRQRQTDRSYGNRCISGKRGGWRRRLSGRGGASSTVGIWRRSYLFLMPSQSGQEGARGCSIAVAEADVKREVGENSEKVK